MKNIKIFRSIVTLGDIDLLCLDTRTENKPVILCLHGRGGRAEVWYHFMQHYGRDYRIIAPDQRGHGLSSKPISYYTSEEMADDILALIEQLKLKDIILVGHSMGASVAAACIDKRPEIFQAVAFLDKSADGPEQVSTLPLEQLPTEAPMHMGLPLPFSCLQEAMAYLRQATESEFSYQYYLNNLYETVDGYYFRFSPQATIANEEYYQCWYHILSKLRCPVLLISAGSFSVIPKADYEKMKSLIPDCIAHVMSNPDHNVQLANQEEFYSYFDELLARVRQ
jgi:2-succinyl-6-hydroxy-2,4-cyclohexadiene-1-carboxylate synthase